MPRTDSRGIPYAPQLLARLRTCLEGGIQVPHELLVQVIAAFEDQVSKRARRGKRDMLIRRAGLLTGFDNPNAMAETLVSQMGALQRPRACGRDKGTRMPAATVRECLQEALLYGRLPQSHRQFVRILNSTPTGD